MLAKDRVETDILIQLEAAHSSMASTISSLVESMMEKDSEGKIVLDDRKAQTILRLIKKS